MNIVTNKGKEINIRSVSDWFILADTPSTNTRAYEKLVEKFGGTCGVYLVAKTEDIPSIGSEIIHKQIGYCGKSGDVFDRIGSIRSPKGTHGVNRMIRAEGWDKGKDIQIKYLFCAEEDVTDLENHIHDQSADKFGTRFKWEEASGGNAGTLHEWLDTANLRLSVEEIVEAIPKLRQIVIDKKVEEVKKEVDTLFGQTL